MALLKLPEEDRPMYGEWLCPTLSRHFQGAGQPFYDPQACPATIKANDPAFSAFACPKAVFHIDPAIRSQAMPGSAAAPPGNGLQENPEKDRYGKKDRNDAHKKGLPAYTLRLLFFLSFSPLALYLLFYALVKEMIFLFHKTSSYHPSTS